MLITSSDPVHTALACCPRVQSPSSPYTQRARRRPSVPQLQPPPPQVPSTIPQTAPQSMHERLLVQQQPQHAQHCRVPVSGGASFRAALEACRALDSCVRTAQQLAQPAAAA